MHSFLDGIGPGVFLKARQYSPRVKGLVISQYFIYNIQTLVLIRLKSNNFSVTKTGCNFKKQIKLCQ